MILDDEPVAVDYLKCLLGKFKSFEVTYECSNAFQAIEILEKEMVDLLFLDIKLPEISGLELLKLIPNHPYAIITTAYDEYALDCYDLDIVDFLRKPITLERFIKALNRFSERTRMYSVGDFVRSGFSNRKDFVLIHEGKDSFKVFLNQINYVQTYGEYIWVTTDEKKYLVRRALYDFEKELPLDMFIRIHKSYLVNILKVIGFNSMHVILKSIQLPIGRNYKEAVLEVLRSGD